MADYLPKFTGGPVTFTAEANITGGQLVKVGAADRSIVVGTAAATTIVGVAAQDCLTGDKVAVHLIASGSIGVPIAVGAGGIAVGAHVEAGAAGTVQTVVGLGIGLALTAAVAGEAVQVLWA